MQLPKFLQIAIDNHNTSLGNNKAFPNREDVSFEFVMIKRRYSKIIEKILEIFDYVPTVEECEKLLSKELKETIELEKPLRPQLEKLCESIVTTSLGVPEETVLLNCELVNKIVPDNELRILPEYDEEEPSYTFEDVDELEIANKVILKRRMVNALVQGASYTLMNEYFWNDIIQEWCPDLQQKYEKIVALNDYLLFSKQEKITDKEPMLGSYVETHLGKGNERTIISAQGLVFPLLLQETYRGFFELFGSHGLPKNTNKANYILHHSDFIMAEAWDLRIGVPLWNLVEKTVYNKPESSVYPYLFSSLVQLKVDNFNKTLQNIFSGTNFGKNYVNNIINKVIHDEEYNKFKNDMEYLNIEKALINDVENEEENNSVIEEGENNFIYSDQFKSIFGDWENDPKHSSFVVDNNGIPMLCYHSTEQQFDEFDPDRIGSGGAGAYNGYGFNFTTLPNNTYGRFTKEVYLNARKPLTSLKKKITLNKLVQIILALDKGESDSIACEFTGNYVKIGEQGYYNEVVKAAKQLYEYAESDLDIYANLSIASCCGPQKVINTFSKLGYDSSAEYTEDGRLRIVVVFSPQQIIYPQKYELKEQIAYHGGKKNFDSFSTDFMGSGEGTQSYGWGVYVTSEPETANFYCDASQRTSSLSIDGKPIKEYSEQEIQELGEPFISIYKIYSHTMEKTLSAVESLAHEIYDDSKMYSGINVDSIDLDDSAGYRVKFCLDNKNAAEITIKALNNPDIYNRLIQGNKINYTVEIPDDNGYNYLYWEKEYDGEFIKELASKIKGNGNIELYKRSDGFTSTLTGEKIYKTLVGNNYFGDEDGADKAVSLELKSIGFDGISMPIGFIHKNYQGDGRNYVIFDASKVKILSKNQLHESVDNSILNWFKGSKVCNPDGSPKIMYRGDSNDIDSFDRSFSKSSNLYGTGFYFTDSESHAKQYGNPQKYLLKIIHPLSTNGHEITKKQLYNFLIAVDGNEDYGLYNYGYGSTPKSVLNSIYGKSDFSMIFDINLCCIGDMVEATLLFNKINGTNFDGFILDTETVVFDNSQIKRIE